MDLEKPHDKSPPSSQAPSEHILDPVTSFDPRFEVSFTGDDDSRSPRSLPTLRKWLIVSIVSATSLCVACTSSLYTSTYTQIEARFDISEIVAILGLTLFAVGLGLSPMILAPLSEFYGRKPIYIGSLFFFVAFLIPCAVAQNIQTLFVARFFNGFAGSAFLSVAGSTVGDLFPADKLSGPMLLYTLSPFLGPQFGPLFGGFINYYTNWRWSFYFLLIWAGAQYILLIFLVPETYQPILLRREAQKLRKETGEMRWHAPIEKMHKSVARTILTSTYRPFLLLTLEPMCACLCIYCAVLLGIVYLFFEAFDIVFAGNHGFNAWQVGLSFLGITVGMLLTIFADPLWRKNYTRLMKKREAETGEVGVSEPEFRLPPAILGAPLVTIGLLWFGWTTYSSIHWIVPIIGTVPFGAGVILIFSGVFTFLVAAYPTYAASALAANSFTRSMFAAGFPLFGGAMYKNLGDQWATFVLAMITLVMGPFPYIFYKYGKQIRARSRYGGAR
ncbi:major facilitator superfamily domain-containing protein [Delphinella strobiligena]|nr:major facilitator superfamily domain-containing protein [Delphinella strobiligena]